MFKGWGRKPSGQRAIKNAKQNQKKFLLQEDGFIRSVGLGVNKSPAFSVVNDNLGIFYDATAVSKLELILNSFDFEDNKNILEKAKTSIELITKFNISKYNNSNLNIDIKTENNVLIIAQTDGDLSLKYGYGEKYSILEILDIAISENPNSNIYFKTHPDTFNGKKKSNLNISEAEFQKKYPQVKLISENINPILLLKKMYKIYTKTSQMGFEALLLNKKVVLFGVPFYSHWGLTDDRIQVDEVKNRRTKKLQLEELFAGAYILYSEYFNPTQNNQNIDILETLHLINKYRNIELTNSGTLLFLGFSKWKQNFIKLFFISDFFKTKFHKKVIFTSDKNISKFNNYQTLKIFIWGKKEFPKAEKFAKNNNINIYRVEDGFIRSFSLGSDLTQPFSIVTDPKGIYFDPNQESDLENILNFYKFDESLTNRAKKLQQKIIDLKVSKYNISESQDLSFILNKKEKKNQKIILAVGQVENDASIIYGGFGMNNLQLLQKIREFNSDSLIIYKPHPDVLAGNRQGKISQTDLKNLKIETLEKNISLDSLFKIVDEVHTITSLTGFDALLRNKKVVTYGIPFYAGWGLTEDKAQNQATKNIFSRRNRKLKLTELVAGSLILYPRYINPNKKSQFAEPEIVLDFIAKKQKLYQNSFLFRNTIKLKNSILRVFRRILEKIFTNLKK